MLAPVGIGIFYIGILLLLTNSLTILPDWACLGADWLIDRWIRVGESIAALPPGLLKFNHFPWDALMVFVVFLALMNRGIRVRLVKPQPLFILLMMWGIYRFFNNFVTNLLV